MKRAYFPAVQQSSIWSANRKVFASRLGLFEQDVRLFDQISRKLPARWMQIRRRHKPAGHCRQQRWEQHKNWDNANQASTYWAHKDLGLVLEIREPPVESSTERASRLAAEQHFLPLEHLYRQKQRRS